MFTINTAPIQMTVNGSSQGRPIGINVTSDGTYLLQLQAVGAASLTTGIYPVVIAIVKNLTAGGTSDDVCDGSLMVNNGSSSHDGSGWSGGLQQITVGTLGSTLMITDGTDAPEEFTCSNGTIYTGYATDGVGVVPGTPAAAAQPPVGAFLPGPLPNRKQDR